MRALCAAIPSIDSLYRKYKDMGLEVLGIISIDNMPVQMAKMTKIRSTNKLSGLLMLTGNDTNKHYRINASTTLF